MDTKETNLNRRLAEWAGFTKNPYPYRGECEYWFTPDHNTTEHVPSFTQSLDACFKWLVPKLTNEKREVQLQTPDGTVWRASIGMTPVRMNHILWVTVESETPALALCLVIEKLIDKG